MKECIKVEQAVALIQDPTDTFSRIQLMEGVSVEAFAEHARAERASYHHR